MTQIQLGLGQSGETAEIELEELLATRLLVQGNSGSGKSHLLRRLLEQSAGLVQQVVIDPEGDFASLAERFGHIVVEAADYSETEAGEIAVRVRRQRASVVLNLEGLEVQAQLRCTGTFLGQLFEAPREHWHPALVVVDEAQLFAPAAATGEVNDEARRISLAAMTNLMCRGRKRGLAGVIATQRLAKLAKNVAAEASNFLMGRTFLDIDMLRAADLLGMERRQAEQIRDLRRGQFLALGPALCRRPRQIDVGAVVTGSRSGGHRLTPLPTLNADDRRSLLDRMPEPPMPVSPAGPAEPVEALLFRIEAATAAPPPPDQPDLLAPIQDETTTDAVLADIAADPDAAFRPAPALFQDFTLRCRMRGAPRPPLEPPAFGRRLALARAGLFSTELADEALVPALRMADELPDDMVGVFMLLARAAREKAPCPGDAEIARVYGTHSVGRAKRLLGYMEGRGQIAFRTDLRGRRSAAVPQLGWITAPEVEDQGDKIPAGLAD